MLPFTRATHGYQFVTHSHVAMGQIQILYPLRTSQSPLQWVVHLSKNGTIGFDPQPHRKKAIGKYG